VQYSGDADDILVSGVVNDMFLNLMATASGVQIISPLPDPGLTGKRFQTFFQPPGIEANLPGSPGFQSVLQNIVQITFGFLRKRDPSTE
jgi:hypothetical protein